MKCTLCDGEVGSCDPDEYPYCWHCHYSGAAYSHRWADVLNVMKAGGFDATIWQTGGGCQNMVLALTEEGFGGAHLMVGMAAYDRLTNWEWGVSIMAHPSDYDGRIFYDWVGEVDCVACQQLYALEDEVNCMAWPEFDTAEQVGEFVLPIARRAARLLHTLRAEHHTEEFGCTTSPSQ